MTYATAILNAFSVIGYLGFGSYAVRILWPVSKLTSVWTVLAFLTAAVSMMRHTMESWPP